MIKQSNQKFNEIFKAFIRSTNFQFSHEQKKNYEGLILSQKLKYTVKDNLKYSSLYSKGLHQNDQNNNSTQTYVNRMLLGSIFSRIIGSSLPLSIYLSQKFEIIKDVPLNVQVQGRVTIEKNLGKDRYLLRTEVFGINEETKYVCGQAKIMLKS